MPPRFLTLDEVLRLHAAQIEEFGGDPGIRDTGLLEAAMAMPQAGMAGQRFHAFPFEMAAAYLFHIVKNHPFVDGNKRVGLDAALVFLEVNGFETSATPEDLVSLTTGVATGRIPKSAIAEFLRLHSRPAKPPVRPPPRRRGPRRR